MKVDVKGVYVDGDKPASRITTDPVRHHLAALSKFLLDDDKARALALAIYDFKASCLTLGLKPSEMRIEVGDDDWFAIMGMFRPPFADQLSDRKSNTTFEIYGVTIVRAFREGNGG